MKAFSLTELLTDHPYANVMVMDAFGNKVECTASLEAGGNMVVIRPIMQASTKDPLTLNGYQDYAWAEAIYPARGSGAPSSITIALAGLAGEAGRALQKHHDVMIGLAPVTADNKQAIATGLAHCMWYLAATAREVGVTLSDLGRQSIMQARAWRRQHDLTLAQGDMGETKRGRQAAEPR